MTTVTITNGKLQIQELCAIAALGAKVNVNFASGTENVNVNSNVNEEATKIVSAQFASFTPETNVSNSHGVVATRATLVVLLHRLVRLRPTLAVQGNAILLADMLNANLTPLLTAGSLDCSTIACLTVLEGRGYVLTGKGITSEASLALRSSSITLPPTPLSAIEKLSLMQNSVVLLAVATLTVGAARGLLPVTDAVAAMTCETLNGSSLLFEPEFVDVSRPHRGIVTSATNIRLMLEGSKYVNVHSESSADVKSVRHIPQYHGPARDAILTAFKAVDVELNAGVLTDSAIIKTLDVFHPQAVKSALVSTIEAVNVLLTGSNERLHELQIKMSMARTVPFAVSSSCAIELVEVTAQALLAEIEISLEFFNKEEEQAKLKLAEKNLKAHEAAEKAAAALAKEDEKLATMPEAQRLKVLEKRKKKLEKQLEKEAAKKSTKDGVKVGVGSAAVRYFLQSHGGAWKEHVNVFDLRPTGFSHFLEELFVQLSSGGVRRKPKIAKGAQDFLPTQMQLREKIFNKIRMVFKRHAGVEIETPVFELKETLTGKYGEDSKLIYDLADQGGELLALRYDLTVPFARFMALHNPGNIKRYHIARVYRRDNPQMARGRFREFYQCDFDIAGTYAPMLPDAEVLSIGIEVLQQFPEQLGPFKVKLSHRLLLDAILASCGVPSDKFRSTCSAIDKLDKEPWSTVRHEMVHEKGLPEEVADKIYPFVSRTGSPRELHTQLTKEDLFCDDVHARKAMDDLKLLFDYLDAMGVLEYISFDLSLARGLDYYTGLIYEFVLTSPEHNVGSIAAGGRYDNLVGMFSATGQQIPCVGVSLGIERIFGILQAHAQKTSGDINATSKVFVASTGAALLLPRLEVCKELWRANIAAEIMQVENPKFTKQLHHVLESGIPYMVVIGDDELAKGDVKIKDMISKDEVTVARNEMVEELLRRGCTTTDTLSI